MDAVLIGYKEDKFELVAKQRVNYNDVADEYNWDRDFKRHN